MKNTYVDIMTGEYLSSIIGQFFNPVGGESKGGWGGGGSLF